MRISRKKTNAKNIQLFVLSLVFVALLNTLPKQNTLSGYIPVSQAEALTAVVPNTTVNNNPISLSIPSIKLSANIEEVGLKRNGSMDVPKSPKNTAWYKLGPKPGEIGSAVIAGHINWWTGASSAFASLSKVKVGDKVTTQNKDGVITTFVVKKIKKLSASANATEVFFSNDNKSHLNLVTCVGAWNNKTKQYTQRLIVFTERVD